MNQRGSGFTITEEIRLRLKEKRCEIGLSMGEVAVLIGVSKSTLQGWEYGTTVNCCRENSYRLLRFLEGEYDNQIRMARYGENQSLPPLAINCMKEISECFVRLSSDSQKQNALLEEINHLIRSALLDNEMIE